MHSKLKHMCSLTLSYEPKVTSAYSKAVKHTGQ